MCMIGLFSAIKGKYIPIILTLVMHRRRFNQVIFPRIQSSQQKTSTYCSVDVNHWVILESLRNFKQTILFHCCNIDGVN